MDGYGVCEAYSNQKAFLDKYFYSRPKYLTWDSFIRTYVDKSVPIFSVASGRAINELRLIADGYIVIASDLGIPDCHEASQAIFGDYSYVALDATGSKLPPTGAVVCLGLISLFNEAKLNSFFHNVSEALPPGGRFILDSAGSEQSLLGTVYHKGFLKLEAWLHYLIRRVASETPLSKYKYDLIIQRAGYRWRNSEIIAAAERHGLRLIALEEHDPLTDLERSPLLQGVLQRPEGLLARLLTRFVGSKLRYLRLFAFEKHEKIKL